MKRVWEWSGALDVIFLLNSVGSANLTFIINKLDKSPRTMMDTLDKLIEAGIISETIKEYNARIFSLTDKGKKVALCVKDFFSLLTDNKK